MDRGLSPSEGGGLVEASEGSCGEELSDKLGGVDSGLVGEVV